MSKPTTKSETCFKKPVVRRLARKGGVKRLGEGTCNAMKTLADDYVNKLVQDIVSFTEFSSRKTITSADVLQAIKNQY